MPAGAFIVAVQHDAKYKGAGSQRKPFLLRRNNLELPT